MPLYFILSDMQTSLPHPVRPQIFSLMSCTGYWIIKNAVLRKCRQERNTFGGRSWLHFTRKLLVNEVQVIYHFFDACNKFIDSFTRKMGESPSFWTFLIISVWERIDHGFHLTPVSYHIDLKFFMVHLPCLPLLGMRIKILGQNEQARHETSYRVLCPHLTAQFHGSLLSKILQWISIAWRKEISRQLSKCYTI